MQRVWKNCIVGLWTVALFVGLYLLAWGIAGNELVVPAFSDCIKSLGKLLISGGFWRAFWTSFLRVVGAFFISLVLAVVVAVVSYLLPTFARVIAPFLAVVRAVPTLAVLLIILVWTSARVAPIIVAFLTLFPTLYTAFYTLLTGVDKDLLEMSRIYKVPVKRQIFQLYLPSVAPQAVRECSASLGLGLKLVVSAEVLAGTYGSLGGFMQDAKAYLDMPLLFALVVVCAVVGVLLEGLGAVIARRMEGSGRCVK